MPCWALQTKQQRRRGEIRCPNGCAATFPLVDKRSHLRICPRRKAGLSELDCARDAQDSGSDEGFVALGLSSELRLPWTLACLRPWLGSGSAQGTCAVTESWSRTLSKNPKGGTLGRAPTLHLSEIDFKLLFIDQRQKSLFGLQACVWPTFHVCNHPGSLPGLWRGHWPPSDAAASEPRLTPRCVPKALWLLAITDTTCVITLRSKSPNPTPVKV